MLILRNIIDNEKESTYKFDISGRETVDFVLKCINEHKEKYRLDTINVLDVGCGTGQLTRLIGADPRTKILAFDIDDASLNLARTSSKNLYNINYINSSVEDFTSEEKYDIILLTQVLDHIVDPTALIKKIRNYLCDNGKIIIGISNGYGPYEVSKKLFPKMKKKFFSKKSFKNSNIKKLQLLPFTCNNNSPHIHKYSIPKLRKLLGDCGFKIVKLKKLTFLLPAFPFSILFYNTSNRVSRFFERIDSSIAKLLPASFSSNWYLLCDKTSGDNLYE